MDKAIVDKIKRKAEENKDVAKLFLAIDDIDKLRYSLPSALQKKDWARIDVDTSGHDALKSATNIFSAYMPTWDVQPLGPNDNDRAEELEAWLEWQMLLIDRRGGSLVWDVMKQATTYDMYCGQVDYLPNRMGQAKSKRQKQYLRHGKFVVTSHHPSTVLYEKTSYGLEWVSVAENTPASDVLNYWLPYMAEKPKSASEKKMNAGIKKLKNV
ncbi:MAG: hypothetical protein GY706_05530, partial [Bacteroides sp.]|nr:hypothetical protein [Bacteroides sp.]